MLAQTKIINHNQHHRRELPTPNYHVYMVRMWTDVPSKQGEVRLSAEDTRTGQRTGFTSWDKLVQHLQRQIAEPINKQ